jgi:hypothetical protein
LILTLLGFMSFSQNNFVFEDAHPIPSTSILGCLDYQLIYYSAVRKIMYNELSAFPEIRFLVLPLSSPDQLLMIEKENDSDKYFMVYRIAEENIWKLVNNTESGKKIPKISTFTSRVEIDEADVYLLKLFFKTVIEHTYYNPDDAVWGNNTAYFLQVNTGWYGNREGTIWSPVAGSIMDKFVHIVFDLIEIEKRSNSKAFLDSEFKGKIEDLIYKTNSYYNDRD